MNRKKTIVLASLLAAGLLAAVIGLTAADNATTPLLPGITAKDEHPNGCVDCHIKVNNKQDFRLVNLPTLVKGHPDISKIVKKLPDSCEICHNGKGKPPKLSNVVHQVHFKGGADNHFVANYQGQCLNCHQLDLTTGVMSVKSGAANW
jgi:hypothetical protein